MNQLNRSIMVDAAVVDKVNAFLIEEFEIEEEDIQMDANLIQALDLDSLDIVDLVVVIEANFGFKVTREDFKSIVTFRDFYDYIQKKVGE